MKRVTLTMKKTIKKAFEWVLWVLQGEELGTSTDRAKKKGNLFDFLRWLLTPEPLEQSPVLFPKQDGLFRWLFKKESL